MRLLELSLATRPCRWPPAKLPWSVARSASRARTSANGARGAPNSHPRAHVPRAACVAQRGDEAGRRADGRSHGACARAVYVRNAAGAQPETPVAPTRPSLTSRGDRNRSEERAEEFNLSCVSEHVLGQPLAERAAVRATEVQPDMAAAERAAFRDIEPAQTIRRAGAGAAYRAAHPRDVAALAFAGDIALRSDRVDAARDAYRAAYNLKPAATLAEKFYRASTAGNAGRSDGAAQGRGRRTIPATTLHAPCRPRAALRSGERERAIERDRAMLKKQPQDVVARTWRGSTTRRGRVCGRTGLLMPPSWRRSGWCSTRRRTFSWRTGRSRRDWATSTRRRPSHADAENRDHLAAALARGKRQPEARRILEDLFEQPGQIPPAGQRPTGF